MGTTQGEDSVGLSAEGVMGAVEPAENGGKENGLQSEAVSRGPQHLGTRAVLGKLVHMQVVELPARWNGCQENLVGGVQAGRSARRVRPEGKRSAQRAKRAEATGIETEIEGSEIAAKSPAAKRVAQRPQKRDRSAD